MRQESAYKKIKSYSEVTSKKNRRKGSKYVLKGLTTDGYQKEGRTEDKIISASMTESISS